MLRQFHLLTDWYVSVLEDIKSEDGSKVISENTNSLEWIAGHLIVMRCRNIARLGMAAEPFEYLDAFVDQTLPPPGFRPFSKERKYPDLVTCTEAWLSYSTIFMDSLASAGDNVLATEIPLRGPTGGTTIEDLLTSIVLHESFHIGQMSIIRKAFGYKAMYWFAREK